MNNLIYHRRKLLDFDTNLHQTYNRHSIPRYYSEFYPWYQTEFTTLHGPDCYSPKCGVTINKAEIYPTIYDFESTSKTFSLNKNLIAVVVLMLLITSFI